MKSTNLVGYVDFTPTSQASKKELASMRQQFALMGICLLIMAAIIVASLLTF